MLPEDFDILSEITELETMVVNRSIRERFVKCVAPSGDSLSVTPGQYYQVLSDPSEIDGMLRVVDNTAEDYLYIADKFEPVADLDNFITDLTISLTVPMKVIIQQMALQRGISMAALLREWIDERLDLPVSA